MNAASKRAWLVLVATVILACGSNSPSADTSTGGMSSSSAGNTGSGGNAAEQLTEPQIFKVLDTIHSGKIAEAEMAGLRGSNADVLAFAESLITAHEQAAAEVTALEEQRAIVPMDSQASLTLAATSSVEVDNLTGAAAATFDETYLQGQIAAHARVVPLVSTLLGMAKDAALKDELKRLTMMSNQHHSRATVLLSGL
jgi:predicted outer membrane protein